MQKKILVVDDERDFTDMIAARLEKSGYSVVKAYNAEEASLALSRESLDLILMDHMLPVGSGLGLLEMIRSFGKAMLTPVILITAAIGDDIRRKALSAGATDFIAKPASPEELLGKIERALGKK